MSGTHTHTHTHAHARTHAHTHTCKFTRKVSQDELKIHRDSCQYPRHLFFHVTKLRRYMIFVLWLVCSAHWCIFKVRIELTVGNTLPRLKIRSPYSANSFERLVRQSVFRFRWAASFAFGLGFGSCRRFGFFRLCFWWLPCRILLFASPL